MITSNKFMRQPTQDIDPESNKILDTQFTFHQDVGELYFSMTILISFIQGCHKNIVLLETIIFNESFSKYLSDNGTAYNIYNSVHVPDRKRYSSSDILMLKINLVSDETRLS